MSILQIGILVFTVIECGNVAVLYFRPGSKLANSVGVFKAWEESKRYEKIHELVKYLVNWVAGTKLIFIMMAVVVIVFGSHRLHVITVFALIMSILSFFWRLYPMIRRMDRAGYISPKGYSKTLCILVSAFVVGFLTILLVTLLK